MGDETRRTFLIKSCSSLSTLILYGCEGRGADGGPVGPSGAGTFTNIQVFPPIANVIRGGSQTFTSTGGTGSFLWSVSNLALGSITASTGIFTAGVTEGTLSVIATDTAGAAGSGTVTIVSATINVLPTSVTLAGGSSQTFTATGGTGSFRWSISNTNLGSIVATTGVFTAAGTTAGSLIVTATDTAGSNGNASITIISTTLAVTPATISIPVGAKLTFTAAGGTGTYFWTSGAPTIGTIDFTSGAFTAVAAGSVTVTAQDTDNNTANATITVLP